MRVFLSALLGFSLLAGIAAPVSVKAQDSPGYHKKKKQKLVRHDDRRTYGYRSNSSGNSDYHEMNADKLPIGTSRWFEQMEREGRFGISNSP